ncbi:hypothetical protein [Shewanella hafniensis]|uniref:hypothetical protein n=1 Tax=Shewanella hafniensis TaxID=365590 RepID=UPI001C80B091|nr:hypothetical protein [Shewanella hafniensis]MCL1136307.1 hypothetical protein [Shewanella hafniensis]
MVTFGEANYNVLPCCLKITLERSTDPSNTQINTNFSVTTAGTATFSYSNTQTMTISPLLGKSCQGNQRALVSITDTANNLSLWQVELTPTQP